MGMQSFCRLSDEQFKALYLYASEKRPVAAKTGTTTLMMFVTPGPLYETLIDAALHFEQRLATDEALARCWESVRRL
jgi:hypothetical protein